MKVLSLLLEIEHVVALHLCEINVTQQMRDQLKATQSLNLSNQNTSDVNLSNQNTQDLNLNLLEMFWTINKLTHNDHAMKDWDCEIKQSYPIFVSWIVMVSYFVDDVMKIRPIRPKNLNQIRSISTILTSG